MKEQTVTVPVITWDSIKSLDPCKESLEWAKDELRDRKQIPLNELVEILLKHRRFDWANWLVTRLIFSLEDRQHLFCSEDGITHALPFHVLEIMNLPTKAEWNAMGFSVPEDLCADEVCPFCKGERDYFDHRDNQIVDCRGCHGTGRLHKRTTEQEHNRTPKGRWT